MAANFNPLLACTSDFNPLLGSTSAPLQQTVVAAAGDDNRIICPSFESLYNNEDLGDEDITIEELKARMAHDDRLLKYLEEKRRCIDLRSAAANPPSLADIKKKKLARSQDIILKHMWKMMRECDVQGFVYGIVPSSEKPISASSDNLRDWWQQKVRFDMNATDAILQYNVNVGIAGPSNSYMPAKVSPVSLMEFQDQTLGNILSALVQHCTPPQRAFPLDKGVLPPWWPKGKEAWWSKLVTKELKRVPYRKPHDLNKAIKAGVIIAVLKHLMPKTELICKCIRGSRSLHDKLTTKEMRILFSIIKKEEEIFLANNNVIEINSFTSEGENNDCGEVNSHDVMRDRKGKEVDETSSRKRVAEDLLTSSILKRQYVCENSGFSHVRARGDHPMPLQWRNKGGRPSVFRQVDQEILLERLQARQRQEWNQGALAGVPAEGHQTIQKLMSSYEYNANLAGPCQNQDPASFHNSQPVHVQMSRSSEHSSNGHQQNHVDMQEKYLYAQIMTKPFEQNNNGLQEQQNHVDMHENTILEGNDLFSDEDLIRFANGDSVASTDDLNSIQPLELNQDHQIQQQVEMNRCLQPQQVMMNSSPNEKLQDMGNQEHAYIDEGLAEPFGFSVKKYIDEGYNQTLLKISNNLQPDTKEGGNIEFVQQQQLHYPNEPQRQPYVQVSEEISNFQHGQNQEFPFIGVKDNYEFQQLQNQPDDAATGFDFEIFSQQNQPTDNVLNAAKNQSPPTDASYQQEYVLDDFYLDYLLGNQE